MAHVMADENPPALPEAQLDLVSLLIAATDSSSEIWATLRLCRGYIRLVISAHCCAETCGQTASRHPRIGHVMSSGPEYRDEGVTALLNQGQAFYC